jgi:uncharacterized protein
MTHAHSDLDNQIAWVGKYLPHQGTLQHFVHHNTLQSFEEYSFEEACRIAKKLYKGYCFLEPKRYLDYIESNKISKKALEKQVNQVFKENHLSKNAFFSACLNLMYNPPHLSIKSIIEKEIQKEANQKLIDEIRLIIQSEQLYKEYENPFYFPSYRDLIRDTTGVDIDDIINPLLAKLFSSYIDPGSAYWRNEYKDQGLWACFKENYKSKFFLENILAKKIQIELTRIEKLKLSIDDLLLYYCSELKLKPENTKTYLLAMGLRLRGWASLFNQLEHDPEQILDNTSYSLKEFLLVKMVFEYVVSKEYWPQFKDNDLSDYIHKQKLNEKGQYETELLYLTVHFLKINQLLKNKNWDENYTNRIQLLLILKHFMREQRLFIYQNALEQTYADQCLKALTQANLDSELVSQNTISKPEFTYVTCIDDREESLRRYIEQIAPQSKTFGIAGHFEMNMHFKGFNEVRYRKLCPGVIAETFKVNQVEIKPQKQSASRVYAKAFQTYSLHSKISILSYLLTVITGYLSAIPFFLKVFWPRLDLVLRRNAKKAFLHHKNLVDLIFHADGNAEGISYEQGADKVYQLLRTIDLQAEFSQFIYIVGHGSSSINNPHEYAYNCGACGGGKGRPNGRIFSTIANHPEVRKILVQKYNLEIPCETIFVGGYHDTCKDNVVWFDSFLKPEEKTNHTQHVKKIDQALRLNAAERARKFYNISPHISVDEAYSKVSARSNDLTEARPEYNHATNGMCIIGRRSFTQNVFMDRRSFLCSYNPEHDDGSVLAKIMGAAIPVCAGINLEYYFSAVDPEVFGCGSKLNHNITNNYAVMSGFASDLRLGLSKQMVEIHDPQRILIVIESRPEIIHRIMDNNQQLAKLIKNQWVKLVIYEHVSKQFYVYQNLDFIPIEELEIKEKETQFSAYHISQEIKVDAKNLIPVAILERKNA